MLNTQCTHTSDWHKEMIPCSVCGAEYSDEEAERIGNESTRTFSAGEVAILERLQAPKPRIFRCIHALAGGHVHTTIFNGYPGQTLARLGSLTFNEEEFSDFRRIAEDGAGCPSADLCSPVAWEFKSLDHGDAMDRGIDLRHRDEHPTEVLI